MVVSLTLHLPLFRLCTGRGTTRPASSSKAYSGQLRRRHRSIAGSNVGGNEMNGEWRMYLRGTGGYDVDRRTRIVSRCAAHPVHFSLHSIGSARSPGSESLRRSSLHWSTIVFTLNQTKMSMSPVQIGIHTGIRWTRLRSIKYVQCVSRYCLKLDRQ
ncbi:hypothetical protein BKA93DRAFT_572903 [Sparassis latifolia]